uniref:Uncharacterized protein n=1 Tax=Pipistrellus kuhlii TaxID=59472 RepID=A0A7J7YAJ3_PIPKU|nr:hypothetical protein mPipKuh1_010334 [Pipistrellus kuhlii]
MTKPETWYLLPPSDQSTPYGFFYFPSSPPAMPWYRMQPSLPFPPLLINSRIYLADQMVQNCQSDLLTCFQSPIRLLCSATVSELEPFAVSPANPPTPAILSTGPKPSPQDFHTFSSQTLHFSCRFLAAQRPPGSPTSPWWANIH